MTKAGPINRALKRNHRADGIGNTEGEYSVTMREISKLVDPYDR